MKITYKVKLVVILISILLLVFSLLLLFSYEGKMLQSKLFGKYLLTKVQIKDVYTYEFQTHGSASKKIHEWRVMAKVNFSLNNKSYKTSLQIKSFQAYESAKAKQYAINYKEKYSVLDIYYNPDDPNEIILNKEDETFSIIIYGALLLWAFLFFTLVFILIDFKKTLIIMPNLKEKCELKRTLKADVLKQKKAELEKLEELKKREELKWKKYDFLNYSNHELEDLYYKDAINAQAIQQWKLLESWLTIFLMEKSIIIVFYESIGFRIEQFSFEKFLTKAGSRYNHTLVDLFQREGEELFEEIVKAIKAKNHE